MLLRALLAFERCRTHQDDLAAKRQRRLTLDARRRLRHDDDRLRTQRTRGIGNALRVIAAGISYDATLELVLGQRRDLVVRTTQLEAADGLFVFRLQPDLRRVRVQAKASRMHPLRIEPIEAGANGSACNALLRGADVIEGDQ